MTDEMSSIAALIFVCAILGGALAWLNIKTGSVIMKLLTFLAVFGVFGVALVALIKLARLVL